MMKLNVNVILFYILLLQAPPFNGDFTYSNVLHFRYTRMIPTSLQGACVLSCKSYIVHQGVIQSKNISKRNGDKSILIDFCIKCFFDNIFITKTVFVLTATKDVVSILSFVGEKYSKFR